MSRLMAKIPRTNARVISRIMNELVNGASSPRPINTATTANSLLPVGMRSRSLPSKQTRRFHRQDQGHRRVERKIGDLWEQRLAEIIRQADDQRPDRRAAQAAHTADDDDREGDGQDLEVEPGINAQEGAADHAAQGRQ